MFVPVNRRGRRRVTFSLRTNLTCGSNGCTRPSAINKDSFLNFQLNENALRTAMRDSRKVNFPYRDGAFVRAVYFSGRKGAPFDVCRNEQVSSIRGKLTLCSKCSTIQCHKGYSQLSHLRYSYWTCDLLLIRCIE